jgi:hypothetical protein
VAESRRDKRDEGTEMKEKRGEERKQKRDELRKERRRGVPLSSLISSLL